MSNQQYRFQRKLNIQRWRLSRSETNSRWIVLLWFILTFWMGAITGGFRHDGIYLWNQLKTFQVDGKAALFVLATPVITFFAALIALIGAVVTTRINRDTAERKRKSDELSSARTLTQSRLHFERKELQDQFVDIQNRLSSTELILRAHAVLRLAQFGETRKPGIEEKAQRSEKNHPYFVPVVSQLATALYLEPKPEIGKTIREAFKNLIAFAKDSGDNQPLLNILIERLVDANRTTKEGFIRALAE